MKLNKKGFTLIELLAVIAILAILIVLAVPNILNLFQESRESAYKIDAQSVYEAAQTQWQLEQLTSPATSDTTYDNVSGDNSNKLKSATLNTNVKYCVVIDKTGKVKKFSYSQSGFANKALNSTDIQKSDIDVEQSATEASCN